MARLSLRRRSLVCLWLATFVTIAEHALDLSIGQKLAIDHPTDLHEDHTEPGILVSQSSGWKPQILRQKAGVWEVN